MTNQFGDFQTPPTLVSAVLDALAQWNIQWTCVLEPTCGKGNFIQGILNHPAFSQIAEIQGLEIQPEHLSLAQSIPHRESVRVTVHNADIFKLDLAQGLNWTESGKLLVVGNPPWVTNAALGSQSSTNLPPKRNFQKRTGIEAITGASKFDIAEAIWLKLVVELCAYQPTIALLCKDSVARKVILFVATQKIPVHRCEFWRIDAQKEFRASADAGLLGIDFGGSTVLQKVPVFSNWEAKHPHTFISVHSGTLISDAENYERLKSIDGKSNVEWRQGVKHDAAEVMELQIDADGNLTTQAGDSVEALETDYLFPLLKSTDLYHQRVAAPHRRIIIPQKRVGEDTLSLAWRAPKLWAYLNERQDVFARRKSTVYKGTPPFSIFGIGEYSFAPYKVAISGLHKTLRFTALGPCNGRPVLLDDTCYFLSFTSALDAALYACLLNDPICIDFLKTIIFLDAKRPVTKRLLQRIDFTQLRTLVDLPAVEAQAEYIAGQLEPIQQESIHDTTLPKQLRFDW